MPAETPAGRGRRLVDALIVWITPDRQIDMRRGRHNRLGSSSSAVTVYYRTDLVGTPAPSARGPPLRLLCGLHRGGFRVASATSEPIRSG